MKLKKLLAGILGIYTFSIFIPLQANAETENDRYVEDTDFPYIAYHILSDHVEVTQNPKIEEIKNNIIKGEDYRLPGVCGYFDKNGNFIWYDDIPSEYEEIVEKAKDANNKLNEIAENIKVTDIEIKSSIDNIPVTIISDYCFRNNEKISSVILPDSIAVIGSGAFDSCSSLSSVTIKNPDCNISDNSAADYAICNKKEPKTKKVGKFTYGWLAPIYNGIIYGYENSTAQAYAEKYGYRFEVIKAEQTKSELSFGDLNGDSAINAVDASIILSSYARYATSNDKPSAEELSAGDIDKNGTIDSVDASIVLSYYAYVSTNSEPQNLTDYIANS